MSTDFDDVQRIVLVGTQWIAARHLLLDFTKIEQLPFLNALLDEKKALLTTAGAPDGVGVQFSLGFTRLGLKEVDVPERVLAYLALKSPAFWAGAAQRAASHLGLTGANAPEHWDERFAYTRLHAVLSIHARSEAELNRGVEEVKNLTGIKGVACDSLEAIALDPPPEKEGQWVHFGYRDGLSRIGIEGWTAHEGDARSSGLREFSWHKAGEFVLGHVADCGASPWVAGPGLRVWPEKLRAFFHNGSFGVLQQIEQNAFEFDRRVGKLAAIAGLSEEEIKAKLCGRYPDGRPLVDPHADPTADFDYENDPKGFKCPFGSHVRRMNFRAPLEDPAKGRPTEEQLEQFPAHFSRRRPLQRRGMPYGEAWEGGDKDDGVSRGLIGQFFCASIENQFEHLMGQWGDRVPLGSPDGGGARDPFIGAHEPGDGPFEIPRQGHLPLRLSLQGEIPLTRTVGAAYLFYPSLTTLRGISKSRLWSQDHRDSENDTVDVEHGA